ARGVETGGPEAGGVSGETPEGRSDSSGAGRTSCRQNGVASETDGAGNACEARLQGVGMPGDTGSESRSAAVEDIQVSPSGGKGGVWTPARRDTAEGELLAMGRVYAGCVCVADGWRAIGVQIQVLLDEPALARGRGN